MSRSFKKVGIIKDSGLRRAEYNRKFRRVNKQRVRLGLTPKHRSEPTNPWDICDWKFFYQSD